MVQVCGGHQRAGHLGQLPQPAVTMGIYTSNSEWKFSQVEKQIIFIILRGNN